MIENHYLQVNASGLVITVSLNGVPLVVDNDGEGIQETVPANLWLKKEDNILFVTAKLPEAKDVDAEKGEELPTETVREYDVIFFHHQSGAESPQSAQILSQLSWPDSEIPEIYPNSRSEKIEQTFLNIPRSLLWSQAATLTALSVRDKQDIYAIAVQLADLLSQKKLDDAFQLMKYRYDDEALVEGKPAALIKNVVLEMWDSILSQQGPQLQPIVFEELNFDVVGENKLVLVTQSDGYPAIEFEDKIEEISYGIQLMFAKINNRWTIVR